MMRLLLALAVLLSCVGVARAQSPFSFVAIGDMPYGPRLIAYPRYKALIEAINNTSPEFAIHIGDFKSGASECSDEEFANQLAFFNSFAAALIYTPGDNDWTDCHRANNGGYDPLERLAKLRAMFFAAARSHGDRPIRIERQADAMPEFSMYVENARFVKEGVLFATAHIVGSNNNFRARDSDAVKEFLARDRANVAWIRATFDLARESDARALVLAMQANPFVTARNGVTFPPHSGYIRSIGETFAPLAAAFDKPVLFITGDTHHFRIDHPFTDNSGKTIANITRLEVFGEPQVHAVRVRVDPALTSNIWSFQPLYNPADQPPEPRGR